jgi:Protein of unknown function (DUF5661)
MVNKEFTAEEAAKVADSLGIDLAAEGIELEQFLRLGIELEHGRVDPETDASPDDPVITGKIALAHLRQIPTTTRVSPRWSPEPMPDPDERCSGDIREHSHTTGSCSSSS